MTKLIKPKRLSDFHHNQKCRCYIEGTKITDAKISINKDEQIYICQNSKAGERANNKLGYKYSWVIYNPSLKKMKYGTLGQMNWFDVTKLKLYPLKSEKPKTTSKKVTKYTISTLIFDSLKEAEDQMREWQDNGMLREGSKVFEVTKIYEPKLVLKELKK